MSTLSPTQAKALQTQGHTALVAGAGSGKTRTMAHMVANDLQSGIPAEDIVVCTFTRSAAAHLQQQIAELVPFSQTHDLLIGTIDSVCLRLCRRYPLLSAIHPLATIADERNLLAAQQEAWQQLLLSLDDEQLQAALQIGITDISWVGMAARLWEQARMKNVELSYVHVPAPGDWQSRRQQHLQAVELLVADEEISKVVQRRLSNIQAALQADDPRLLPDIREAYPQQPAYETLRQQLVDDLPRWVDTVAAPFSRVQHDCWTKWVQYYQQSKEQRRIVDFLDVLLAARQVVYRLPSMSWQRLYVDEAQDTNRLQQDLLHQMTTSGAQLIVVGDANQSIYAFRDADVQLFRKQKATMANVVLDENYRQQPTLLATISSLGQAMPALQADWVQGQGRAPLSHLPGEVHWWEAINDRGAGDRSRLGSGDLQAEMDMVVPRIKELVARRQLAWRDVCFLTRTNATAAAYTATLQQHGVPVSLIRPGGLLQTPQADDALALLDVLTDTPSSGAVYRLLASPMFAATSLLLRELHEFHQQQNEEETEPVSLWEACCLFEPTASWAQSIRAAAGQVGVPVAARMRRLLEQHEYDLVAELQDPSGAQWRTMERLLDTVQEIAQWYEGNDSQHIYWRLREEQQQELALPGEQPPAHLDTARCMTIHNAKGLEFPVVVLAGLGAKEPNNDRDVAVLADDGAWGTVYGRLPGGKPLDKLPGGMLQDSVAAAVAQQRADIETEEQQRLLYVAMTRAQEVLVFASAVKTKDEEVRRSGQAAHLWQQITDLTVRHETVGDAHLYLLNEDGAAVIARETIVPDTVTFRDVQGQAASQQLLPSLTTPALPEVLAPTINITPPAGPARQWLTGESDSAPANADVWRQQQADHATALAMFDEQQPGVVHDARWQLHLYHQVVCGTVDRLVVDGDNLHLLRWVDTETDIAAEMVYAALAALSRQPTPNTVHGLWMTVHGAQQHTWTAEDIPALQAAAASLPG